MEENILESYEGVSPVIIKSDLKDDKQKEEDRGKFDFHKWFNKKKIEIKNLQISSMYDVNLDILLKLSDGRLHYADNFNEVFSGFLLCRYLSMDRKLISYACALNTIFSSGVLTSEELYKLAYRMIPKNESEYVAKYIKKAKSEKKSADADEMASRKEMLIQNSIFDL